MCLMSYRLFSCDVAPCCVADVSILPNRHIAVREQELEAESIQVHFTLPLDRFTVSTDFSTTSYFHLLWVWVNIFFFF